MSVRSAATDRHISEHPKKTTLWRSQKFEPRFRGTRLTIIVGAPVTLSTDEQLTRSERRLKLQQQRVALEERRQAVLKTKRRRGERGEVYRRETQEKCVLGWGVRGVLSDTRLPVAARNRIRDLLRLHLSESDQIVVSAWLTAEVPQ